MNESNDELQKENSRETGTKEIYEEQDSSKDDQEFMLIGSKIMGWKRCGAGKGG